MFKMHLTKKLFYLWLMSISMLNCKSVFAEEIKVVYHINENIPKSIQVLGNIRYHLLEEPSARIKVVTHGPGIEFLLEGAKATNGSDLSSLVASLASQGVEFYVCRNTLTFRKIPENKVILEAKVVPSGVAEIARLQAKEGYVYLKP